MRKTIISLYQRGRKFSQKYFEKNNNNFENFSFSQKYFEKNISMNINDLNMIFSKIISLPACVRARARERMVLGNHKTNKNLIYW